MTCTTVIEIDYTFLWIYYSYRPEWRNLAVFLATFIVNSSYFGLREALALSLPDLVSLNGSAGKLYRSLATPRRSFARDVFSQTGKIKAASQAVLIKSKDESQRVRFSRSARNSNKI
jgi:hypothetical protein